MAMASAKDDSAGAETPTGSETGITGVFKAEGMTIGFDYTMGADTAKNDFTGIGVGGSVAGVQFHYISQDSKNEAGDALGGMTEIAVAYGLGLGEGATAYPQFATKTFTKGPE